MANIRNTIKEYWNKWNMSEKEDELELDEYEEDEDFFEDEEDNDIKNSIFGRKKVSNSQVKMGIIQLVEVDQAYEVSKMLRDKKAIIINLELANKEDARRMIDIITGAAYVLDGYMKKISNSIFLIAPSYYDIFDDESKKNKVNTNIWLKNNVK